MSLIKKLKILPTEIYEFKVPYELNRKALALVKEQDWNKMYNREAKIWYGKSNKGYQTIHNKEEWYFLTSWLQKRVDEVYKAEKFDFCDQLKICLMWSNKSEIGQWHAAHTHPWSILSGIVYLEGSSGKTWFSRENDYIPDNTIRLGKEKDDKRHMMYKHPMKEASGLIFPSKLTHSVDTNESPKPRYSLAFNTFPTGAVGEIESLAGLRLEVL
jgi:uncharacterized protein (TIGR02466 family)